MSDARVRALERAWLASGDDADLEAYLSGRRRAAALDEEALSLAAYLGSDPARSLLGRAKALALEPPKRGVSRWLEQLPLPRVGEDAAADDASAEETAG